MGGGAPRARFAIFALASRWMRLRAAAQSHR
jgi:hypothetical protein